LQLLVGFGFFDSERSQEVFFIVAHMCINIVKNRLTTVK
jgi:hypothetical protein